MYHIKLLSVGKSAQRRLDSILIHVLAQTIWRGPSVQRSTTTVSHSALHLFSTCRAGQDFFSSPLCVSAPLALMTPSLTHQTF